MKRWHVLISILAIAVFGVLFSQDALARLAWQKYGRPDIALALVRRDAGLAMQLGNYYFNGTIGRSEYNLEKAERAFQKAVTADNKILWGHYQLSRIYFVKGDYAGALLEINKELEANPENLRSLYVRGLIYGYRNSFGDLELAEKDFRRFTYWAPKEWSGYNDLAWILSKQGKYKEVKEAIKVAFREAFNAESNPWLWNSLGVAELNLGEYDEAGQSFEKAKTLAEKLVLDDWRRSYPGNNPKDAEFGLKAFLNAIKTNLQKARAVDKIN